jgi:hypothetical protein
LLTGSSCARKISGVLVAALTGACAAENNTPGESKESAAAVPASASQLVADTLAKVCPGAQRGSVLVARPDSTEEESQVTFKLLGDGAGPGVVLCRKVLYARADTLLALMGERATVDIKGGRAVIDGQPTQIQAYLHEAAPYVELAPFARDRQALLIHGTEHRMDATIWPRETLLHMKALGPSRRGLYDSAVRAGLLPD